MLRLDGFYGPLTVLSGPVDSKREFGAGEPGEGGPLEPGRLVVAAQTGTKKIPWVTFRVDVRPRFRLAGTIRTGRRAFNVAQQRVYQDGNVVVINDNFSLCFVQ